jgi:L-threonylcarbamoyladenylate synthase
MVKLHTLPELTPESIREAVVSLDEGGLACLPNDTVYGIACKPDNSVAVDRIYRIKQRERDKPLAMVFGDTAGVFSLVTEMVPAIRDAVTALLPGPVTVVLDAAGDQAAALSTTLGSPGSLAVRVVPPPLDSIYKQLPSPLALTSANLSGQPDPCTMDEVAPEVLEECDFAIDAGRCTVSVPSTIMDLRPLAAGRSAVILREGAVSAVEIRRVLENGNRKQQAK